MHNHDILLISLEAQDRAFTLALACQKVYRRLDGTFGSIDADCFVGDDEALDDADYYEDAGSYEMRDVEVSFEPDYIDRKTLVALSITMGQKVRAAVGKCRTMAQLYTLIDRIADYDDWIDELLCGRAAMTSLWRFVSKALASAERHIRKKLARRPAGMTSLHSPSPAKQKINDWLRGRKEPIRIDGALVAFDALRMAEKRTVAKAVLGLVPIEKLSDRPRHFARVYRAMAL